MNRLAVAAFLASASLCALAGPARAQEASESIVRLNRMEGQVRTLSGQVEQLQFDNRQLKETLRKFQEDVDFRFQERGRAAAPATTPSAAPTPGTNRPARRGDAYDPAANPDAPGAPRTLGTTAPARSGARDGIAAIIDDGASTTPLDLNAAARSGNPAALNRPAAGAGGDDAKAEFDAAYALVSAKQYGEAEAAMRRFLQAHPRDRHAADATFWLGESYLQRSRFKEAAEQFLKVSTDHTRAAKAPDALLKLGVSLAALGARDQACATFAELERKYPTASPSLKQGVDREQKRTNCPG